MKVPISINGRFLSRRLSGVERCGLELTRALGRISSADGGLTVFVPRDTNCPALEGVTYQKVGQMTGGIWEQMELPFYARGTQLLNFCNMSPIAHNNSILFIHDAQTRSFPSAYSFAFRLWYRYAQPLMAKRAIQVVTVSEHSQSAIDRYKISRAEHTIIIPNGSDHILSFKPKKPPHIQDDPPRFALLVGSASPHKNLETAINALLSVRSEPINVVAVGRELGAHFGNLLGDSGRRVTFIESVSDSELRWLYEHATLFLFPSLVEGFGLPPLEAMMCGCPVIASNTGALPEVCGDAAILLPPLDQGRWTNEVERLLADKASAGALSHAGKVHAAGYTWNAAARRLLETIHLA